MKTISRRGKGIIWAGLKNPAGDRTRNISLAAIRDLLSADIFRPFFCASKKTGGKWAGLNKSLIEARDNYYFSVMLTLAVLMVRDMHYFLQPKG